MIRSSAAPSPMNRRTVMFAIAALLAVGTGWLTFTYLSSVGRTAGEAVAARTVVVALRDIPARATITAGMIGIAQRPANAIDPDVISAPANAVGTTARVTIPAGSAITASKIAAHLDVGLTERLHPGMRAISIPIDRVKAVGDLLQPGDHVDVIALTRAAPGIAPKALTILRDTVVLAVGSTLETTAATPAPDGQTSTATLEVTPAQAKLLSLADANTTLRLALRRPQEPARTTPLDALDLAAPPALAPHVVAAPNVPVRIVLRAPERPAAPAVTVIDGDRIVGTR